MSSLVKFPPNPEDGMIFELVSGVFYGYNAGSNCWTKLPGVDSLGLATPLADGLMSKDDFNKLQDLLIPPPQSTIRGEECNTTFKAGTVGLYSFDESLDINSKLNLVNPSIPGEDRSDPWSIHRNTAGFDFRVPLARIIAEIEERNRFKKTQLEGDQGAKGERGEPGEDRLDTGPVGVAGASGVNSPFGGSLTTENIAFEMINPDSNRAIVEITSEEVSDTENYLVVKRANVGNPDACPSLVAPTNFQSPLIVALNTIAGGKLIKNQQINSGGDCALICRVCASSIHHLNMEPMLCQIHDRFVERINQLKTEKEDLVRAWLTTMVSLFNEQKAALCCALENCQSRKRNERTRQYIETQRIQAAQADFSLLIDGEENRKGLDLDGHKDCPIPATPADSIIPFSGGVTFCLDSKIHIKDPRDNNAAQSLSYYLPAGSYQAEVIECCANFNTSSISNSFSGRAAVLHRKITEAGSVRSVTTDTSFFPNLGTFETEAAGRNAYLGQTITFEHDGGDISVWLADPDGFIENNDGKVIIRVVNQDTLGTATDLESAVGLTFVYRNDVSFNNLVGRIPSFAGGISAQDNLGATPEEISLISGPDLFKDQASVFFYDGSDGLSLFFVAGEPAAIGNDQQANIQLEIEITNNTYPVSLRANDSGTSVIQTSPGNFMVSMTIDGDSAGFALGELDPNSNFSITIKPINLSTMRTWIAANPDSGESLILAQGGSEGIGGNISVVQMNSAPLFDIESVPEEFGGGNSRGLQIRNETSGNDVTVYRPVDIDVPDTYDPQATTVVSPTTGLIVPSPPTPPAPAPTAPLSTIYYTRPSKSYFGPGSTGALPYGKLHALPVCEPPPQFNDRRIVDYDTNTGVINDPQNPVPVNYFSQAVDANCPPSLKPVPPPPPPPPLIIPAGDTSNGGAIVVGGVPELPVSTPEDFSSVKASSSSFVTTERGAPGSPQDPCIVGMCITMRTDVIQSFRYIFTDKMGNKFYSAFVTTDPGLTGSFQNVDLSAPIKILSPPPEFTPAVINGKNIAVADVANKLTSEQVEIASNLNGIVRLTYIQELLGLPIDNLPDANNITDIEIQFQNMPVSTVDIGEVVLKVGLPGAVTEILLDDFEAPASPPVPEPDPEFIGEIKRVVATQSGPGLAYSGIDNYFGDYTGFDVFNKVGVDFNGNNFFTINTHGNQLITRITGAQGFGNLKTGPFLINTTPGSGNVAGDAVAVDAFGVVYVADGPAGEVYAVFAQNGQINNTTHVDAHQDGTNLYYKIASGLPKSPTATITIGKLNQVGPNIIHDLTVNFGGQWFTIQGADAVFFPNGNAYRNDVTTQRCCFGNGTGLGTGNRRIQAVFPANRPVVSLGSSPGGNSVDTSAPSNPQPTLPTSVKHIGPLVSTIQGELDASFNQFEYFSIEGTKLYKVALPGGTRTLFRDLEEQAFGVRVHPTTKDVYYITNNRGTTPSSGTTIKRVDIDKVDGTTGLLSIKTVYEAGSAKSALLSAQGSEGIFGITFGVSVPTDPTTKNQVLYALLSTLQTPAGSANVRLVEIAELKVPVNGDGSGDPLSASVPTNSVWNSEVSSGGLAGNPDSVILSKLIPGNSCQMHYKQVQWYERGWRIGACCGALVEEGGIHYIVVKRSIGTDTSCGGGESESTICISQFISIGEGHPAIAWPAIQFPDDGLPGGSGEEFLGIPTSGFANLVKDEALSTILLNKIKANDIVRKIGRPELDIPFILFPSTT